MTHLVRSPGRWFAMLGLALLMAIWGCEGTESREKVDNTVEEMSGMKSVDRYQDIKKDLDKIQKKKDQRYQDLDEAAGKE